MLRATKQDPAAASWRVCAATVSVLVVAGLAAAGLRGSGGEVAQAAVQEQGDESSRTTARPVGREQADQSDSLYMGFVPNETQGFVAIRPAAMLSRPEMKPLADFLAKNDTAATPWGVDLREIEQISLTLIPPVRLDRRRRELVFPFGAVTIRTKAANDFRKLIKDVAPDAARVPVAGREYFVSENDGGTAYFRPDDRTIVLGSVQDVSRMVASGPEPKWERLTSAPAADAVADAHYAAVVKTALIESLFGQAQAEAGAQQDRVRREAARAGGGGAGPPQSQPATTTAILQSAWAPLWEQSESITFALRVSDKLSIEWLFTSANPGDAEAVRRTVDALLTLGRNMSGNAVEMVRAGQPEETAITAALKLAEELLANAELQQDERTVRLETSAGLDDAQASAVAALTESVKAARGAARRTQSMNNLKQIAIAFHNYHDVHQRFPPAVLYGPDGRTPHSWRVAILPFIEQVRLYEQYRFDEPWDSEHNRRILKQMPPMYRHPEEPADSTNASYFALVGEETIFTGKQAPRHEAGTPLREISDGASNTVLIVEADRDIPWTKPEDILFDPEKDVPELGGYTAGGFHAAVADGSVKFIADAIDSAMLKALITRAGGEPIDRQKLELRPRR